MNGMSIPYGFFVFVMLVVGVMWATQYNILMRRVRSAEFRSRVLLRVLRGTREKLYKLQKQDDLRDDRKSEVVEG